MNFRARELTLLAALHFDVNAKEKMKNKIIFASQFLSYFACALRLQ
jgi:hypothetical protein